MPKGARKITITMDNDMFRFVCSAAKSYEVSVSQFVAQLFLDRFKELTQEIAKAQEEKQKQTEVTQ